jgi:hypothetical protein
MQLKKAVLLLSVYLSVHKVRLCFCSSVHLSFNGVQSFICMFVQGFFDVWKICIKVPSVCLSVCLSVFCLVFLDVWKIFYRIWAWQKEASSVKELEEGETKRNETKVKKNLLACKFGKFGLSHTKHKRLLRIKHWKRIWKDKEKNNNFSILLKWIINL